MVHAPYGIGNPGRRPNRCPNYWNNGIPTCVQFDMHMDYWYFNDMAYASKIVVGVRYAHHFTPNDHVNCWALPTWPILEGSLAM